jgi:hypothetical protein
MKRRFSSSSDRAESARDTRDGSLKAGRLRMIYAAPHIPEMHDALDDETGIHVIAFHPQ